VSAVRRSVAQMALCRLSRDFVGYVLRQRRKALEVFSECGGAVTCVDIRTPTITESYASMDTIWYACVSRVPVAVGSSRKCHAVASPRPPEVR
jgi:hypothetical protein